MALRACAWRRWLRAALARALAGVLPSAVFATRPASGLRGGRRVVATSWRQPSRLRRLRRTRGRVFAWLVLAAAALRGLRFAPQRSWRADLAALALAAVLAAERSWLGGVLAPAAAVSAASCSQPCLGGARLARRRLCARLRLRLVLPLLDFALARLLLVLTSGGLGARRPSLGSMSAFRRIRGPRRLASRRVALRRRPPCGSSRSSCWTGIRGYSFILSRCGDGTGSHVAARRTSRPGQDSANDRAYCGWRKPDASHYQNRRGGRARHRPRSVLDVRRLARFPDVAKRDLAPLAPER